MKIIVFGAGAWGTAMAVSAAARHEVSLWSRSAAQVQALRDAGENRRYLPGIAIPHAVHLRADPLQALAGTAAQYDLAIIATPMSGLRAMLQALPGHAGPVAWLCKGFESSVTGCGGLLGHEIQAEVAPALQAGALSGPSFALEVARGQPTALVAGSPHAGVRATLVEAFHGS
ncbi:MAG: 2-dehydropantoate 2-reductase N-terminal domain-containing protein, partial [Ramlibacter sp.]